MKSNAGVPAREVYTERVTVYLTPEDLAYLEAMPVESLSGAVRACIAWHKESRGSVARCTGFDVSHSDYERFLIRCTSDKRDPAEVLAALLHGYATMPTAAELREAIERGPEDE